MDIAYANPETILFVASLMIELKTFGFVDLSAHPTKAVSASVR